MTRFTNDVVSTAAAVDSAMCITKGVSAVQIDESGDPLNLDAPMVFHPPHTSPRISAQGSLLMICPRSTEEVALPFCGKVVIKIATQFTIKKRLNACAIGLPILTPAASCDIKINCANN